MWRQVSTSVFLGFLALSVVTLAALGCDEGGSMSITGMEPVVGHTQGDQPVRIFGSNFRQDIGYTVYFGAKKAGTVTILSEKIILATTPGRNEEGHVDVTIRADDGSAFRMPKGFEFKEMSSSDVVGGLGEAAAAKEEEKGNLPY